MADCTWFSGEKLKAVRTAAGMSRFRLAQGIGFIVGPQTIIRYEKGHNTPRLDVAMRIAAALNVPMDHLLVTGRSDAPR